MQRGRKAVEQCNHFLSWNLWLKVFCSYKQERCVYSVKELGDEIARFLAALCNPSLKPTWLPQDCLEEVFKKKNISGRIGNILTDKSGICIRQVSYYMKYKKLVNMWINTIYPRRIDTAVVKRGCASVLWRSQETIRKTWSIQSVGISRNHSHKGRWFLKEERILNCRIPCHRMWQFHVFSRLLISSTFFWFFFFHCCMLMETE